MAVPTHECDPIPDNEAAPLPLLDLFTPVDFRLARNPEHQLSDLPIPFEEIDLVSLQKHSIQSSAGIYMRFLRTLRQRAIDGEKTR